MPVNEILAPVYLRVQYQTPFSLHNLTLYFETGSTIGNPTVTNPNNFSILNSSGTFSIELDVLVASLFTRAQSVLPPNTTITKIEGYRSLSGVNQYVGDSVLPSSNVYGTGVNNASSYFMYVYRSLTRQKARFTFFDGVPANPQRVTPPTPPLIDDNSVGWFLLRGQVPFATQDGNRLVAGFSHNTGYNRKLARRYGRFLPL